jgi:dolichyl-phosphate-mannose--protein O-mannosyl transferase
MKKIKEFFNEEGKFNVKDALVLTIIVVFYSILSFINLGTTSNPNTFFEIDSNAGLIIELKEKDTISKIKFYNGRNSGDYYLSISDDGENYNTAYVLRGHGAFQWDEGKFNKETKYIKLVPKDKSSLTLGEIALYNNGGEKITTTITSNKDKIYSLSDEASTIPKTISFYNSSYFDEIYFARSAYEYVNGLQIYEWTHPPLGKLIQAIPIAITGEMTQFNYRFMGNLAGILMIVVMYLFAKDMFRKRKYSIFAALLMTFDTFHFAQTRLGTIDSFLVLFILLSFFFMFKYCKYDKTRYVALSGLFFSLSVTVKWTGLYAGLGLAIIYFVNKISTKKKFMPTVGKGLLFFVLIPLIIYTSTYILFPNLQSIKTNSIETIVEQQKLMYDYHSNLVADHPFTSKWYTWPIGYKPVWYYTKEVTKTTSQTISSIPNVLIWWPGIIAMLILPYYIFKKKNGKSLFLLVAILSLYLPYIFIGRIMFLYHYFPVLPFLYLAITNFFYQINKNSKKDWLMLAYMMLVIIFFIVYYPIISGTTVSNDYIENTKLFDSWVY